MATIILSAAGAAIGGSIGGTVAGLSTAVVARAIGGVVGRVIDQRLLGNGSDPVETGKVDRFRLTDTADGAAIAQIYGRMRVGGQVILASDFTEITQKTTSSGGGKGAPSNKVTTVEYSYIVSLAIALCEGEIGGVTRIWADGEEIALSELNLSVYKGDADQMPDPVIEAIEGADAVPAYRGTAYVVLENLDLEPYGNRVPQFSFEIVRGVQEGAADQAEDLTELVQAVALIPGTGEYALATKPVYNSSGQGQKTPANLSAASGLTDLETSVAALQTELPRCQATSLVVSWFGNDLRCGMCEVKPKVERRAQEGSGMPWNVSGLSRAAAEEIARDADDRPIYGGTPTDAAVLQAIRHLTEQGQGVMFYPFILMDQTEGNTLTDPWTGADTQPVLPWRGRITVSVAPGQDGTPDRTATADDEVAAFFGTAQVSDFAINSNGVTYSGSDGWSFRRFILHYAALCAAAGGVEAFCIGSEMRSLTQIRGANDRFAAVESFRQLATDVRAILGPDTKISYATDWSEYFGYQPTGENSRYFHLDALWASDDIDFIGIDNYMPLSDWRDGDGHADASWPGIYDADYLSSNVEGGEGYDWFYHSDQARDAQIRTPITDEAYNEPWIWRYKDLRNWWQNAHYDRIDGVRAAEPTAWEPQSKPFWFTELGCAAVDTGTNQPNTFLDPKSSESRLPYFFMGARDDLIQRKHIETVIGYWRDPDQNPVSELYGGPMIDPARIYIWAYDTRPFPAFPNNLDLWGDGENYLRGHWISGRAAGRPLASVVAELCRRAGLQDFDVSALHGFVRGYTVDDVSDARSALQPLMLRFGFDAVERDGVVRFISRDQATLTTLDLDLLAESDELDMRVERTRASEAELAGRVRLRFVEADGDHAVIAEEAVQADEATHAVSPNEIPIALTRSEGRLVVERWLAESRVSRDTARFALPLSQLALGAGDTVRMPNEQGDGSALFRIDQVELTDLQVVEATRIEPSIYQPADLEDVLPPASGFVAPVPVEPLFLDLPLMTGDEVPHAPHLALTGTPWPGTVALYSSASDSGFALEKTFSGRATIGVTETVMTAAQTGVWDRGPALQVRLLSGTLDSKSPEAILNGANLAAIGDGSSGNWELFQFEKAELIGDDSYWLTGRLRGQLGSDALMPDAWPTGSWFVLLNGVPEQTELSSAQLRMARYYRIGPAVRSFDDASYVERVEAFDGNGLRPYAPVHLRAHLSGGDVSVSWIRRTRIDGDSWDLPEVPLGEESELYRVRVMDGTSIMRETTTSTPTWTYTAAAMAADGATSEHRIDIAQISARFGAGPDASVNLPAGL